MKRVRGKYSISKEAVLHFAESESRQNQLTHVITDGAEHHPLHLKNFQQAKLAELLTVQEMKNHYQLLLRDLNNSDARFCVEGFVAHVKMCPDNERFRTFEEHEERINQEIELIGANNPAFAACLAGLNNLIEHINLSRRAGGLIWPNDKNDSSLFLSTPLLMPTGRNFFGDKPVEIPAELPGFASICLIAKKKGFIYTTYNDVTVAKRVMNSNGSSYHVESVAQNHVKKGQLVRAWFGIRGGDKDTLYLADRLDHKPVLRLHLEGILILADEIEELRKVADHDELAEAECSKKAKLELR